MNVISTVHCFHQKTDNPGRLKRLPRSKKYYYEDRNSNHQSWNENSLISKSEQEPTGVS